VFPGIKAEARDMKPVFYVAGPYRSQRGEFFVRQNVMRAERVALRLWQMGGVAVCPHKNTAQCGGYLPDEVWLEGDLDLVRVAEAVVLTPHWRDSAGARGEREFALSMGKPVFEWPRDRSGIIDFIAAFGRAEPHVRAV
jgi:hypothetical protein